MKKTILIGTYLVACFAFGSSSVLALGAQFSQTIKPVECVMTQVQNGTGSSLTVDSQCGQSPTPVENATQNPSVPISYAPKVTIDHAVPAATFGGLPQDNTPPVSSSTLSESLYLNSLKTIFATRGALLLTREGVTYTFRLPQDYGVLAARTLHILTVNTGGMLVRLAPDGGDVWLPVGEPVELNLAYDSRLDLRLAVYDVSEDGSAALRVTLYPQPRLNDSVQDIQLLLNVLCGVLGVAAVGLRVRYRRRHPVMTNTWHNHFYAM